MRRNEGNQAQHPSFGQYAANYVVGRIRRAYPSERPQICGQGCRGVIVARKPDSGKRMREENYQRLLTLRDAQEEVNGTGAFLVGYWVKELEGGNEDESKRQEADDRKAPWKQALTT